MFLNWWGGLFSIWISIEIYFLNTISSLLLKYLALFLLFYQSPYALTRTIQVKHNTILIKSIGWVGIGTNGRRPRSSELSLELAPTFRKGFFKLDRRYFNMRQVNKLSKRLIEPLIWSKSNKQTIQSNSVP